MSGCCWMRTSIALACELIAIKAVSILVWAVDLAFLRVSLRLTTVSKRSSTLQGICWVFEIGEFAILFLESEVRC